MNSDLLLVIHQALQYTIPTIPSLSYPAISTKILFVMGNSAAKEWKSTELSRAKTISANELLSILPSLVSKEATRAESKGKTWMTSDAETLLWSTQNVGMIKSHSVISDKDGNIFAVNITEKMSMTTVVNFVCKSTPSFEGQEPLSAKELKRAGIADRTVVYKFSKIDTVRKMTTAKATYSVVTGKGENGEDFTFQTLYTGDKLSSMGFMAIFKEEDIPVAKAQIVGMKMKPIIEVSPGVDMLAVVLMGYALSSGDANAAGALAGAGVV